MRPILRLIGRILGNFHAFALQVYGRYFVRVERFDGNAQQICKQIIDQLWDKDFYRTSLGHYNYFWTRDFGTACAALVHSGHTANVHHTLHWAIKHFRRGGAVTTSIDSVGIAFDAPAGHKAIDSLPWLLHSIWVSHYQLNITEREFLNKQLRHYTRQFLVKSTGHIKPNIHVAEMRDAVLYDRSAYAVTMVARMARCAEKLGLDAFLYSPRIYRDLLLEHYWNGRYFNADYNNTAYSSECALFPFYMGIVDDKTMATKTFNYIDKHNLNHPYPLKYTDQGRSFKHRLTMQAPIMPDYQDRAIWSWHGIFYLRLLKRYNDRRYPEMHARFSRMIERHGTWPEMLNTDGSWYYAPLYRGDPGMLWCVLYLDL